MSTQVWLRIIEHWSKLYQTKTQLAATDRKNSHLKDDESKKSWKLTFIHNKCRITDFCDGFLATVFTWLLPLLHLISPIFFKFKNKGKATLWCNEGPVLHQRVLHDHIFWIKSCCSCCVGNRSTNSNLLGNRFILRFRSVKHALI